MVGHEIGAPHPDHRRFGANLKGSRDPIPGPLHDVSDLAAKEMEQGFGVFVPQQVGGDFQPGAGTDPKPGAVGQFNFGPGSGFCADDVAHGHRVSHGNDPGGVIVPSQVHLAGDGGEFAGRSGEGGRNEKQKKGEKPKRRKGETRTGHEAPPAAEAEPPR